MTTAMAFPLTPSDLGLPGKFSSFRPSQESALNQLLDSGKRISGLSMSTGSGKTLSYMAYASLRSMRTVVLVVSKGLQTQTVTDFSEVGLVDCRGRNNFDCSEYEGYNCEYGARYRCEFRKSVSCGYWAQYRRALQSKSVVTNYSYKAAVTRHGEGLGPIGLLVLDECHDAPDEICRMASVDITSRDVYRILNTDWPDCVNTTPGRRRNLDEDERDTLRRRDMAQWSEWAGQRRVPVAAEVSAIEDEIKNYPGTIAIETLNRLWELKTVLSKLDRIHTHQGEWAWDIGRDGDDGTTLHLEPLWAKLHTPEMLGDAEKVILASACLTPKTIQLLGFVYSECDFFEFPSSFPERRWPVVAIQGAPRMSKKTSEDKLAEWIQLIDRIIETRLDRKGIIHTFSYDRAEFIARHSRFRGHMKLHSPGEGERAVAEFKVASAPNFLVSPSVSTGYDFPGDECRWIIIAKVPYPPMTGPLMEARQYADPTYGGYLAAKDLVQAAGRGMRSDADWCEIFITDGAFSYFARENRGFMPYWFRSHYTREHSVPEPLRV